MNLYLIKLACMYTLHTRQKIALAASARLFNKALRSVPKSLLRYAADAKTLRPSVQAASKPIIEGAWASKRAKPLAGNVSRELTGAGTRYLNASTRTFARRDYARQQRMLESLLNTKNPDMLNELQRLETLRAYKPQIHPSIEKYFDAAGNLLPGAKPGRLDADLIKQYTQLKNSWQSAASKPLSYGVKSPIDSIQPSFYYD